MPLPREPAGLPTVWGASSALSAADSRGEMGHNCRTVALSGLRGVAAAAGCASGGAAGGGPADTAGIGAGGSASGIEAGAAAVEH